MSRLFKIQALGIPPKSFQHKQTKLKKEFESENFVIAMYLSPSFTKHLLYSLEKIPHDTNKENLGSNVPSPTFDPCIDIP
jgi:hypothetical protein